MATSFDAAASRRRLAGVARHGAFAIARHSLRGASCAAAGAINDPINARVAVRRSMAGLPSSVRLFRRPTNSTIISRSSRHDAEVPDMAPASSHQRLEPLRHVDAGPLNIAYYEAGPANGPVAVLLHGFPYDIHSYVDVAPQLASQGCRVIVPYLRGYGPTLFRDTACPRSGEQAAMGADLMALLDALQIQRAALWPDRCIGLVCVNSYLIQDIPRAMKPAPVMQEVAYWYQYYFQIERGRAGLAANRRDIAKILWKQWSPNWDFDDPCFERTALAFDNPDYVDVVIHSYRHRYGLAESDPQYADIQRKLAALPQITVPAITLDGAGDGVAPATDGKASASKFANRLAHRVIPRAGHNLPQEEPEAFARAVMELIGGHRA